VAVHFGGGMWGLIAASMFGNGGVVFGASKESGSVKKTNTTCSFTYQWPSMS
jgi:hypothetical protein